MTAAPDRRGLVLAVLGCVLAAALPFFALDQVWLQIDFPAVPPHPASTETFIGREVKPDLLLPLGIFFGAAGLALLPSRRTGRLVVAAGLVAAGLLLIVAVWVFLADGGDGAVQYLTERSRPHPGGESGSVADHELSLLPAVLTLVAGAIAVAVGILTSLRSPHWPVMGARYERRSRSREEDGLTAAPTTGHARHIDPAPSITEAAMWSALERGEDPTLTSPDPHVQRPGQPPDQPVAGR